MELGNQIKKYRTQLNLSQEELASTIYVSRQTISNWENDKSYPDVNSLIRLSEVFDISLDILIKGDILVMKEEIKEEDIKTFGKIGNILTILFVIMIVSAVPLFYFGKIGGIVCWATIAVATLYVAGKVEKQKKEHHIQTYKQIVAFMDGKCLDEIENTREEGKMKYQKFFLVLFSGLVGLLVCTFMGFLIIWLK
ncbi:MAG: helix-turn-helix transcriptional regulator [bacterium]|nr:helix-turn-helix transcriptional regulator [bacterium]